MLSMLNSCNTHYLITENHDQLINSVVCGQLDPALLFKKFAHAVVDDHKVCTVSGIMTLRAISSKFCLYII